MTKRAKKFEKEIELNYSKFSELTMEFFKIRAKVENFKNPYLYPESMGRDTLQRVIWKL